MLTSCDKLTGTKTISGEYRHESQETLSNGLQAEHQELYDFRSDGSYASECVDSTQGARNAFTAKGTYKIKGRNVELEQTYFAINDQPMGDPIYHETFSLEQNGDLITDDGTRLKKQ
jgi:hypothetical protein